MTSPPRGQRARRRRQRRQRGAVLRIIGRQGSGRDFGVGWLERVIRGVRRFEWRGGSPGGDGGHTTFGNETTATATQISTPTIKFGATEFEHGVGGAGQDGGVVLYLIW